MKESEPRENFLEDADLVKLAQACAKEGPWMVGMLLIGATYGWRKSEVRALQVRQVDLLAGLIRLDVGSTKNAEGRVVAMTADVKTVLAMLVAGKRPDEQVFTWPGDGRPIKDFRDAWAQACKRAGVPGLHFHDLCRTAARNLRKLGLAEALILATAGWKTRSVFDRYNIVSEDDMREVARRVDNKGGTALGNCYGLAEVGVGKAAKPN